MPLVRISVPNGKGAEYLQVISAAVHQELVEVFKIPPDDRFQVITEHAPGARLVRPKSYLGNEYSDDLIIIQITANDGRTVEQKKALYRGIAQRLSKDLGLRPQDVIINLVEVRKENWSFGNGEAPYA
jgi:phenylpyruvate tautomerase PptA (4-oxalocrotonate tautomerase family)